jgi:hypothetical protein
MKTIEAKISQNYIELLKYFRRSNRGKVRISDMQSLPLIFS